MRSRCGKIANNAAFADCSQGSGAQKHQWHLEAYRCLAAVLRHMVLKALSVWRYRDADAKPPITRR
jgi:hypothetical protein